MQNNNFAATLASVASEFGVEDTAKHDRGIKPSVEAEPEPELNPVSQDLNPTDVDIDRMIFTAFDAVVGRVDDFNKMAACWRKALSVIEQEIRKLSYIIEQHPDAEDAVCHIAAIIAYDKTNA